MPQEPYLAQWQGPPQEPHLAQWGDIGQDPEWQKATTITTTSPTQYGPTAAAAAAAARRRDQIVPTTSSPGIGAQQTKRSVRAPTYLKATALNLGISSGLQAAQTRIANKLSKEHEAEARAYRGRLDKDIRAGKGISGAVQRYMERKGMQPVRAFARESRKHQDALASAAGGTQSAAAAGRSRREARRDVQAGARGVGLEIGKANIAGIRAKLEKRDQLRATERNLEKGRAERKSKLIGGIADRLGAVLAHQAARQYDLSELKKAYPNASDEDLRRLEIRLRLGRDTTPSAFAQMGAGMAPWTDRQTGDTSGMGERERRDWRRLYTVEDYQGPYPGEDPLA